MDQAGLGTPVVTMKDKKDLNTQLFGGLGDETPAAMPKYNPLPTYEAQAPASAPNEAGMFGQAVTGARLRQEDNLRQLDEMLPDNLVGDLIGAPLRGLADVLEPEEEAVEAMQRRHAERQPARDRGDIKADVADVADAVATEGIHIGGTFASGWAGAKMGAAAMSPLGVKGKALGGVVGFFAGAAAPHFGTMFGESMDEAVRAEQANAEATGTEPRSEDTIRNDPETRDRAYISGGVKSIINGVVPIQSLYNLRPQQIGKIVHRSVVARAGKELGTGAIKEASTEALEKVIDYGMMNPELLQELSQEELQEFTAHLGERLGNRETAIELVAAAVAGGGLTGVTGGVGQHYQNQKIEADGDRLMAELGPLGLTEDKVRELSKSPEGVQALRESLGEIGVAKTVQEANLRSLDEGVKTGAYTEDETGEIRGWIQDETDEAVDRTAKRLGLSGRISDIRAVERENEASQAEDAKVLAATHGIKPTKELTPEASQALMDLDSAAERVETTRNRAESIANPERKAEAEEEFQQALLDERVARINARVATTGQTEAQARKAEDSYQRQQKQKAKREEAVQSQYEAEFPDDLQGPARRERAAEIVTAYNEDPSADQKGIERKIKRLERQRREATKPETIAKLNEEISDLEARKGLPTPAVEAAQRVLQETGGDLEPEPEAEKAEAQPERAAALDTQVGLSPEAEAETGVAAGTEAETSTPAPTASQARAMRLGLRRGRKETPASILRGSTPETRADLLTRAQAIISGEETGALERDNFVQAAIDAGYKDRTLLKGREPIEGERLGEAADQVAAALVTAANEEAGLPSTDLEQRSGAVSADDPRRGGYDDTNPWNDLIDEIDHNGTQDQIETELGAWTRRTKKEASAHFDAEGNLLGVGTNNSTTYVMPPHQGFGDENVVFSHTHPVQITFSAGDVVAMMAHGGPYRAVLPDGQVIQMRPLKRVSRATIMNFNNDVLKAMEGEIDPQMPSLMRNMIRQETLLRHLDDKGIIEYTTPYEGLTEEEQDRVENLIDATQGATASLRRGADDRTRAEETSEQGGSAGEPDAGRPPEAETPETRAERDSRVVASPERVKEIADRLYDFYQKPRGRGNPSNMSKLVRDGDVSPQQLRAATNKLVMGIGNKSNYVLRDMAHALFPEMKENPQDFITETSAARYRGGRRGRQFKTNEEATSKYSSALDMLNDINLQVFDDQDHFFYLDSRWVKRSKTNQNFKAYHIETSRSLKDWLDYQGSPTSALKAPLENPDDVSRIKKKPREMAFTDQQMEPGKRTARYFQRNAYQLDHDALAELEPIDLISKKNLAGKGLSKEEFPRAQALALKVNKSTKGAAALSEKDRKWMREKGWPIMDQLRTAEKKLRRFRESAEEHRRNYGTQGPVGYLYQMDNKGRIYADGDLNPQTSDKVKAVFKVNGVSLKDMDTVDNSASGWQVAALMARDEVLAPVVNLGKGQATEPGYQKSDMYELTISNMEATIRDHVENGTPQQKKFAKKALKLIFDRKDGQRLIHRDVIKTPIIAVNYAATPVNMREHMEKALKPDLGSEMTWHFADYLAQTAREGLRKTAPHTMAMQDWAIDTISKTIAAVEPDGVSARSASTWTVGLDGRFQNRKNKEREQAVRFRASKGMQFETENDGATLKRKPNGDPIPLGTTKEQQNTEVLTLKMPEVDPDASARSIYSQKIQGFDGSILHQAVDRYKQATGGAFITTNHDAFTAPRETSPVAAAAARESMYEIMKAAGDIPQRIYDDAVRNLATVNKTPEEVGITEPPPRGNYDLEDIRTSTPLFGEDAEGNDIVPEYADLPPAAVSRLQAAEDYAALTGPQKANAVDVAGYMEEYGSALDTYRDVQQHARAPMKTTVRLAEHVEKTLGNMLQPIRALERDVRGDQKLGVGMDSAFKAAEMAIYDSGRTEALLYYGGGKFGDLGEFTTAPGTVGLREIFDTASGGQKNGQQLQHWFEYMVARRARALKDRGIKTPLTDADIATAMARENDAFIDAAAKYKAFNDANLQMLKDSGRITEAQRAAMVGDAFYVPFYRTDQVVDGVSPDFQLPEYKNSRGTHVLARDPGIKKIKGGEKVRIANMMDNMIRNAQAMTAAAARNQAANKIFDLLLEADMVQEKKAQKKPTKDSVTVWRNGKEAYIVPKTEDALPVIASMAGMEPIHQEGVRKVFNAVANVFRSGITLRPKFILDNLWRGMVQNAIFTQGANLTATNNTITGAIKVLRDNQSAREFKMISGMGDYRKGQTPSGFGKDDLLIEYGLKGSKANPLYQMRRVFDHVETVGTASELADRVAVYDTLVGRGVRKDEAAYQALSIMNYSRKGGSEVLRGWLGTLPFLNARIQGYVRTAEGTIGYDATPETRRMHLKRMLVSGLAYSAVNLTAMGWNLMDEDRRRKYLDLPLWRRAMFLNVIMPGDVDFILSLPQPFEVGIIFGTFLPSLAASAITDMEGQAAEIGAFLAAQTLTFNAIPQAMAPIIEGMLNTDLFFKRDIETYRERQLHPALRVKNADELTTYIGRDLGLSRVTNVSPAMMTHYLENVGGVYYNMASSLFALTAPSLGLAPKRAAGLFGESGMAHFFEGTLNSFVFDTSTARDKWQQEFYRFGQEATQQWESTQEAEDTVYLPGGVGAVEAAEVFKETKPILNALRKEEDRVKKDMDMDPQEKRRILQNISKTMNGIHQAKAREMERLMEAGE